MGQISVDKWQYRLSTRPSLGGFAISRFWLEPGPGLDCIPIQDAKGRLAGVVLGQVIDLARKTNGSGRNEPLPAPDVAEGVDGSEQPLLPLWKIEKDAITRTLDSCGGDVQKAAVVLEISASTIYRKLQSWQKGETV